MDWRIPQSASWLLLAVTAAQFGIDGTPYPRPIYVFLGVGGVIAVQVATVHQLDGEISPEQVVLIAIPGLAAGLFLRYSMWSSVVASGSDMITHIATRAGHIVKTGNVIENAGMYTHTPLLHILMAIQAIVTDLWVFDIRFASVVLSALTPILVGLFAREVSDTQTGLYGLLLAIPFPLMLRTGAMFDTESLALPWFMLLLYLLFRAVRTQSRLFTTLFLFVTGFSTYIHFLYPMIIVAIFLFTVVIAELLGRLGLRPFSIANRSFIVLGSFATALFVFSRMFWTDKGATMLLAFGVRSSSFKPPTGILSFLLPTSGAVGRSTATTSGPPWLMILNYAPVFLLLAVGTIGSLYVLHQFLTERRFGLLLVTTTGVCLITILALAGFSSSSTMRLAFRLYYFAGLTGIVFAAIALRWADNLRVGFDRSPVSPRTAVRVVSITFILCFAVLSPMSSLGNTVDPVLGGQAVAMTETDTQQLATMDHYMGGSSRVLPTAVDQVELPANRGPFAPSGYTDYSIIGAGSACKGNRIYAGETFALCLAN